MKEPIVTRAICASISRVEGSVMHELLSIRNELCAPGRNVRARVAMLYTSRWFILWVEGDDDVVEAWLQIAANDKRISNQKVLHRSRGPALLKDPITVSTTQSPLRPTQYARIVANLAQQPAGALEPIDIWRQLATPCLAAPLGAIVRPARQIAIVSAEDTAPTDQLRKLGERLAVPVVYRRFAMARLHAPDVGIAYLDVPIDEGFGRIHVISRKVLTHPMARQAVPEFEALVLLLGTRPAAAIGIATAAADCLRGCATQLEVHVAGAEPEVTSACASLLERAGLERVIKSGATAQELATLLPALGWQAHARGGEQRAAYVDAARRVSAAMPRPTFRHGPH